MCYRFLQFHSREKQRIQRGIIVLTELLFEHGEVFLLDVFIFWLLFEGLHQHGESSQTIFCLLLPLRFCERLGTFLLSIVEVIVFEFFLDVDVHIFDVGVISFEFYCALSLRYFDISAVDLGLQDLLGVCVDERDMLTALSSRILRVVESFLLEHQTEF